MQRKTNGTQKHSIPTLVGLLVGICAEWNDERFRDTFKVMESDPDCWEEFKKTQRITFSFNSRTTLSLFFLLQCLNKKTSHVFFLQCTTAFISCHWAVKICSISTKLQLLYYGQAKVSTQTQNFTMFTLCLVGHSYQTNFSQEKKWGGGFTKRQKPSIWHFGAAASKS